MKNALNLFVSSLFLSIIIFSGCKKEIMNEYVPLSLSQIDQIGELHNYYVIEAFKNLTLTHDIGRIEIERAFIESLKGECENDEELSNFINLGLGKEFTVLRFSSELNNPTLVD